MQGFGALLKPWREFLFPLRCWHCGSLIETPTENSDQWDELFCSVCKRNLFLVRGAACPCCGQIGVSDSANCRRCGGAVLGFRKAAAGAAYQGIARDLVLRLKFGCHRAMAFPLACLAYDAASRALEDRFVEAVVAVPLHPARLRDRGFNQAQLIAEQVAEALQVPFLKGVVCRNRNTLPQGTMTGRAPRRKNIRGSFQFIEAGFLSRLQGDLPSSVVKGHHLLLVDDVLSTGATLDYCGRALLAAGALSVTGAVAAT